MLNTLIKTYLHNASDLAVLQIDPVRNELQEVSIGPSSSLSLGETLICIDSPRGWEDTVNGIIARTAVDDTQKSAIPALVIKEVKGHGAANLLDGHAFGMSPDRQQKPG